MTFYLSTAETSADTSSPFGVGEGCAPTAATIVHATRGFAVDIVPALQRMLVGVSGAQLGALAGPRLTGGKFRIQLAALALLAGARVFWTLISAPKAAYSLEPGVGGIDAAA
jgi:uncharacterized membrane protein YfcA